MDDAPVILSPADAQPLINRMTNWQRNQWARAGYPRDQVTLEAFTRLERSQGPVGRVLP